MSPRLVAAACSSYRSLAVGQIQGIFYVNRLSAYASAASMRHLLSWISRAQLLVSVRVRPEDNCDICLDVTEKE